MWGGGGGLKSPVAKLGYWKLNVSLCDVKAKALLQFCRPDAFHQPAGMRLCLKFFFIHSFYT